jgi:peroxiredoxin
MKPYLLRGSLALAAMLAWPGLSSAEVPEPLKIGADFPDFTLPDTTGQEHSLGQYKDKIVVFTFSTPECPCSRSVDGALAELAAAYADRGVVFIGVNSNFFMDPESLRDYAKSAGITYPILKDDDEKLADATGARVTPEVFIKDKNGKVVFHGPPDNRVNPKATPTEFYLKDALKALTAGRPIEKTNITPWGCSIRGGDRAEVPPEHDAPEEDKKP